jgi:dynein heavy chain
MLVDLPADRTYTLVEFVETQREVIKREGGHLHGKNVEIENAVNDLVKMIITFPLDGCIEGVSSAEVAKLTKHYNNFLYQALLHSIKNSLNAIKTRVGSRRGIAGVHASFIEKPFFEVDMQLSIPNVMMRPSLDNIQSAINEAAKAVLGCSRTINDWGQDFVPEDQRENFFNQVTQDIEIVRVCLLLTGSVQGTRNAISNYLGMFLRFDWMVSIYML